MWKLSFGATLLFMNHVAMDNGHGAIRSQYISDHKNECVAEKSKRYGYKVMFIIGTRKT